MKQLLSVVSVLAVTTLAVYSWAEDGGSSKFRLGVSGSLGMATAVGNFDDNIDEVVSGAEGAKPRFAGGGSLLADVYFTEMIGISTGIGLLGEGWRVTFDAGGSEGDVRSKLLYLQIPVCLLLDLSGFQIGAGIAFDIALTGKSKAEADGDTSETDWEDDQWDVHRRFNIATKLFLGYAIPAGPIFIVPRVEFLVHLLNNAKGDAEDETERHLNIMFGVAVLFGL